MKLLSSIQRYEATIKSVEQISDWCDPNKFDEIMQLVLAALNARDAVQAALKKEYFKDEYFVPNNRLKKIIELDDRLRTKAKNITQFFQKEKKYQLADWRESVQPDTEGWWWRLDEIAPPQNSDYLWGSLWIFSWTSNFTLLVTIVTRFLGAEAGLIGGTAAILLSIISQLQPITEISKAANKSVEELPQKLKSLRFHKQKVKVGTTLFITLCLSSFYFSLPKISQIFNDKGLRNWKQQNLAAAEQDYLTAISLSPDNAPAHYNLGSLYEEFQEFDKAKKQYHRAIRSNEPQPYNNLGRLYIREKQYSQAAYLLEKGLSLSKNQEVYPEVKYSLFKNLGWARLKQNRHEEAQKYLRAAIGFANSPEAKDYIPNPGAAHCLLAQVLENLEKKQASAALKQWEKCVQFGSRENADEDAWLHLAQEKLNKVNK